MKKQKPSESVLMSALSDAFKEKLNLEFNLKIDEMAVKSCEESAVEVEEIMNECNVDERFRPLLLNISKYIRKKTIDEKFMIYDEVVEWIDVFESRESRISGCNVEPLSKLGLRDLFFPSLCEAIDVIFSKNSNYQSEIKSYALQQLLYKYYGINAGNEDASLQIPETC